MAKDFLVDLTGLADFSPMELLGTSALLKLDGYYSAQITKLTPGQSSTGNNKVLISFTVTSPDEKGALLLKDVPMSGTDKNGNPNIRQFGQLLVSVGLSTEQVQGLAKSGQTTVDAFSKMLIGKAAYLNVEAETYQGNTRSNVRGFITKQQHDDAVAAGTHRRPRRAEQMSLVGAAPSQPADPLANMAAAMNAAPSAALVSASPGNGASVAHPPAANPLAALASLQLNL